MKFSYQWIDVIDVYSELAIRTLLSQSIEDFGILGFEKEDNEKIQHYINCLTLQVNSRISSVLLIDAVDESPAGMVVMTPKTHPTSQHIAELTKVIISKKYRGIGILKDGLKEVVDKAKIHNVSHLIFDVREDSDAAKVWRHIGFNVYGRLEDYSRYNNDIHAGLFMHAKLSDLIQHHNFS